ncbi:LysE family translocator [Altericroceibacterium spongiae]|uniref:LysE family translocator n=1 Tax=Altericroceibacterium spongiae TaxID=2320269 RepID=A0A420EC46_9SPHN|nr:LysE family translocator [Altericroceibacterium spongiae]RKF18212.1 LysE family translocator [Altericroceibacterium spongiae]
MSFHSWWLFAVTVFLLSATPGPNMLHILSRSVEMGLKRSTAAMAGCLSAIILVLSASAAGLGTVLLALPGAFDVIRYLGIAYLIWLGIKSWRAKATPLDVESKGLPTSHSPIKLFRGGFAIALSNPKLILFAAAFFPQFIDPQAPQLPQFGILIATFGTIETFWFTVYAMGGQSLARLLTRPSLKRAFNRATSILFIGFGLALLKARPQ